MKILKYITVIFLIFGTMSCQDFMEPALDNFKDPDYVLQSRDDFRGVLYNAYTGIPNRISLTWEAATDNAMTNNENTTSSRAARGGISAINNPFGDSWEGSYTYINRINWFLERMVLDKSKTIPTPVKFDINPTVNLQIFKFTLGEAYFLRAWYEFQLLQKYGGVAPDGKAYGFPISKKYLEVGDDLDLPRNTYIECANQIAADCDSAAKYLPLIYSKASGIIPDGLVTYSGRASGIAAKMLKARAYLYAASPAYNVSKDPALWHTAAQFAADAIKLSNGAAPANGFDDLLTYANYFNKTKLNNNLYDNKDIFFRGPISTNVNTYESENFPPRASSGRGTFNPSQNLVDAFPMNDGFPRNESPSKIYDPENVQANRDPRLDLFIIRSGETWATVPINTKVGGADAFGTDVNATRSGYYLQKLLDGTVRLTTGATVNTTHAPILMGKPELYLMFAEAAINATGNPDDKKFGFSAREVLAKVRNRALGANNDKYLATVTNKDGFLAVVKNERRVELCFEDHRFWDLRRWSNGTSDVSAINNPVYGIYSSSPVESRLFKSPYMPLPYGEMLITNNLVNNAGW